MKKLSSCILTAAVILVLLLNQVHAISNLISYQGILNDSGGLPISATVSMTFSIYDVDTDGTALWSETQSVLVSNGLFNVKLGSVNALPPSVFVQDTLYLGIQVASDQEMTPRQQITSGSYAYKSVMTEETIIPIGGIIAWVNNIPGMPSLPAGWVQCNGQTLVDPESPLNGQVIPDLNGENRFLRGNTVSGTTGGSDTHRHSFSTTDDANSVGNTYSFASPNNLTKYSSSLPPYFDVIWIIKIK